MNEIKWTTYATIITIALTIGGGINQFVNWVDTRYYKTTEFKIASYKIIAATYSQQIATENKKLDFILENHPENKKEIIFIRHRIKELKQQRKTFIQSGHYGVGDQIIINNDILKDQLTK